MPNSLKIVPIQTGLAVAEFLVIPQLSVVKDWQSSQYRAIFFEKYRFF